MKRESSLGLGDHGGSEVTGVGGRREGPPQCSGLQGPSNVGCFQQVRDGMRTWEGLRSTPRAQGRRPTAQWSGPLGEQGGSPGPSGLPHGGLSEAGRDGASHRMPPFGLRWGLFAQRPWNPLSPDRPPPRRGREGA